MLISGDAGIGKSALVHAYTTGSRGTRVLTGVCDALPTPRPLGPFVDVASEVGGRLGAVITAGEPAQTVFEVLAEELCWTATPSSSLRTCTLPTRRRSISCACSAGASQDSACSCSPRTARTNSRVRIRCALCSATWRRPPASSGSNWIPCHARRSRELAAASGIDSEELYAKTAGNPFFVTEVLASGRSDVPTTIRDAVLACAARLGPSARDLLDAVAVVPQRVELWLLDEIAGNARDALDECLASGMLSTQERTVAFRHELARLAVEDAITPFRRVDLHQAAPARAAVIAQRPAGSRGLAHHAEAAGDAAAVLEFAPDAAAHATAVGAHREAAAQYARALRHADALKPLERAVLLERRSFECYLVSHHDEAIAALQEALDLYRTAGATQEEGLALGALAQRRWCAGDTQGAELATFASIAVLEQLGPSPALARAYAGASSFAMNIERADAAFDWGARALQLLDEDEDAETLVYQLNTSGTMALLLGRRQGWVELEPSIAIAEKRALEDHVGRAYIHLGWAGSRNRAYDVVDRLDAGIEYCAEHGLELWRLYLLAYRADRISTRVAGRTRRRRLRSSLTIPSCHRSSSCSRAVVSPSCARGGVIRIRGRSSNAPDPRGGQA